ncbi:MAG: hypothetical protein HZR80_21085 [Candidatus Heimdallarchaeota archaeon]
MTCKKCGEPMKFKESSPELDGPHIYLIYECENGHKKTEITLKELYYGALDFDMEDDYY